MDRSYVALFSVVEPNCSLVVPEYRDLRQCRFASFIHRPEYFGDTVLLVKRREGELKTGEARPIGARRERTGGSPDRVLKEPFRQAEKRQEFRQQPVAIGRQHVDVAGHHGVELRHSHLALIRTALAEEHLPWPAAARERGAVRHVAPRPYVERLRLQVLQPYKPFDPGLLRAALALVDIFNNFSKTHV